MEAVTVVDVQMIADLRDAVRECTARGLSVAAKWASELILAIPDSKRNSLQTLGETPAVSSSIPTQTRSPHQPSSFTEGSPVQTQAATQPATQASLPQMQPSSTRRSHAPKLQPLSADVRAVEQELELQEGDLIANARACMEAREFLRAVHLLRECTSSKARFLSLYSQFMASEKKALREWHKLDNNRHQPPLPVNTSLCDLLEMVKVVKDPWLLFLKALFLSRLSRREEAIEHALLSIASYPWNWSAWTLLASCSSDGEELSSLIPLIPLHATHPLVQMFHVKTLNELNNPSENELNYCDRLLSEPYFPNSLWVMSLRACVLYHMHDFSRAEVQFERIRALDPYRIDDIDIYSNILYVTDNKLKLSRLAHEFLALDKDRPEICCLVGNHYSLRAEHEKAVKYFRRATQLDRTYLSAWTLMGHEYVEMKNSHAAIEAYRRAVDVNRKDYRAWYGLGQAYELLDMPQYSLHYYQRATALRPYDVRLWQAQGMCYEELGRFREAIECLKRALIGADPHEITINLKLAKLHHMLEEYIEAVAYNRRVVEVCQTDMRPIQDYAKSCLYVARQQLVAPDGDLFLAQEYLERVATSNAEEVALATDLLKKVKATIQERAQAEAEPQAYEDTQRGADKPSGAVGETREATMT